MFQEAIGRPMEIMLIEDSMVAARFAIGALTRSRIKHRLTWLTDGEDARQFLFQERHFSLAPRPDLVLLDLNLPHLNGKEILRLLRHTDHLKNIAVVIMTGELGQEGIHEFDELEVQGYLVKPVDLENFLALVETLKTYWKAEMILPTH